MGNQVLIAESAGINLTGEALIHVSAGVSIGANG